MSIQRHSVGGNEYKKRLYQDKAPDHFHTSRPWAETQPFLLSDPGEGIKEVQITQWFVRPGGRVAEWDKVCEVASDKANIDITSRFDGVVKKLHYEENDTVQVGQALCDIDLEGNGLSDDHDVSDNPESKPAETADGPAPKQQPEKAVGQAMQASDLKGVAPDGLPSPDVDTRHTRLATPAVRGLLKEHNVGVADVTGTGADGRVLKEDVHQYLAHRDNTATQNVASLDASTRPIRSAPSDESTETEKPTPLSSIQAQMFKTMTRSLSIPHFLYADELDLTALSSLRKRLNLAPSQTQKLSYLHFIIKAVSLALDSFPLLNARLLPGDEHTKPHLIMRQQHNIAIATDTPQGLLVPNIKDVAALSINDIAAECSRLQGLATEGKLSPKDLGGETFTVSNIGSIGGTYVAPIIVPTELAILGVGKARIVPAFDDEGRVVKKEVCNFSWSADHRVIDGATVARMAECVRGFVERPESMVTRLR